MRSRWRRRHRPQPAEMNITAFMNLMVILVPFLLITAVFSRLAILELSLPSGDIEPPAEESKSLTVSVYADEVVVSDFNDRVVRLKGAPDAKDLSRLASELRLVKRQQPDRDDIVLLFSDDMPYDIVVGVMDAARSVPAEETESGEAAELFPAISIGSASVRKGGPGA